MQSKKFCKKLLKLTWGNGYSENIQIPKRTFIRNLKRLEL
nr:MAG TPA: hypothetical protein [Caudoviricetes sp.]